MEPLSASEPIPESPAARLRRSEEAGRALVAGWEASGLSMRAYAEQAGVRPQRLSYWRMRLGRRTGGAEALLDGFVEISHPDPAAHGGDGVAIIWPNGLRVEVGPRTDRSLLREVVETLTAVQRPC